MFAKKCLLAYLDDWQGVCLSPTLPGGVSEWMKSENCIGGDQQFASCIMEIRIREGDAQKQKQYW